MYTSVANGDVSFSVTTSGSAQSLVNAGKLKFLAIAAPQRLASQPDVPTVKEVGGPAGLEGESWVGGVAPRGTPADVVSRLARDIDTPLHDPHPKKPQ